LNISHVLDALESLVDLILDDSLALPIGSDNFVRPATFIEDGWHLEGEEVNIWLNSGLLYGALTDVVEVALSEEFAREASENDDFVVRDLGHSSTLSLREDVGWHVDDGPVVRAVLRIVSFDRVAVLAA